MRVELTSDDLAAGELLDPGWYAVECVSYEEKPSAGDRSTNYFTGWRTIAGKGQGARTKKHILNEKVMSFGKNLFIALGAKEVIDSVTKKKSLSAIEFSKDTVFGKKVDAYIARSTWNGRDSNEIKDFAPLGKMSGYKGV